MSLGEKIRQFRKKKGLSARDLAGRIDISPSMISKIEHDTTNPSLDILRKIAMELHVSVGDLVTPENEAASENNIKPPLPGKYAAVVKANQRKLLKLPKSGVVYEVLTPDLRRQAELSWVELHPGVKGTENIFHEQGEEYALVLEGILSIYIDDTLYLLEKGDCITFDATLPHCYTNDRDEKVIFVLITIPPTL